MKYIYSADWHLAFKKPRIRTDDYTLTQYEKAKWIINLANELNAKLIIAGDIFDKPSCPIAWLHAYIKLFKSVNNGAYIIYGQHDIHFHNPNLDKTPLGILLEANSVFAAGRIMDVCNFGEEIPSCASPHLCVHRPITKGKPPFFMEDAVSAKDFLKEHTNWEYIVSGDYHEQHVTELNGRILFNPGPITRPSKDKINFIPKVILHDDITNEWKWIEIPHKEDVFDLDMMDKDDRTDYKQKFREFAGSIDSGSVKQNFHENLKLVINKSSVKEETLKIIDKVMEKVNV